MKPVLRNRLFAWWRRFAAWMMRSPPNPYVRHCPNDWPTPKGGPPRGLEMD